MYVFFIPLPPRSVKVVIRGISKMNNFTYNFL